MRADLMDILVCPVCKGELALRAEAAETLGDGREEIVAGALRCAACDHDYRIEDGIPDLLPPDLGAAIEANRTASP